MSYFITKLHNQGADTEAVTDEYVTRIALAFHRRVKLTKKIYISLQEFCEMVSFVHLTSNLMLNIFNNGSYSS